MLRNVGYVVLAFAAVMAGGSLLVSAAGPRTEAANKALNYVRTLQNADGGFPLSLGSDSSAGETIDAVLAFVAADIDPATVKKDGKSPLDYLEAQTDSYITTPGPLAKLVIGLAAAGEDPRDFAGHDLVASMNAGFNSATHAYGDGPIDHALYMLAREKLDLSPAHGSAAYLESKQTAEGCWKISDSFGCDTNTTALAIEALLAAGVDPSESSVEHALDYLEDAQNDDGGFPYDPKSAWGTDSDANSTAFVLQALIAAGEDIDEDRWQAPDGTTPLDTLVAFQLDSGAFEWQPGLGANAMATYQAVPALLLEPYPGAPKTQERKATHTPRHTKTPTPTVAPTAEPTATPLPPSVAPTVVATPPSAAPTSAVAGITVAAAGEGAGGHGDSAGVSLVTTLLLAGGGALMATAGLTLRLRRR
jgi:hypothetical protein